MIGTVIKALSGFYYVFFEDMVYECKARGNFRKSGVSPLVGDRVEFQRLSDKTGIVDKVLDRKNFIERPPIANIDKLFIVSSFESPSPNTLLIDKMTVIARQNNIEPIIVFNKCDQGDFGKFESIYKNAGFKVYTVSAYENKGIDALKNELKNSVSAFTGNSGVGKSSILNCLMGEEVIATGVVSEKLGRGKHTTRHTEIYALGDNIFIADTPGFSTLELGTDDPELKNKLQYYFEDFERYLGECRFASCSHTKESGCAIISAVESGKIEKTRHNSYIQLYDEIKDLKPWEIRRRNK